METQLVTETDISVKMAIQSHLNDAMLETDPIMLEQRIRFVKALVFYHPNTNDFVKLSYCDYLWCEVAEGRRKAKY